MHAECETQERRSLFEALDSLVKHEKNTQLPVLENKQFLIAQLFSSPTFHFDFMAIFGCGGMSDEIEMSLI